MKKRYYSWSSGLSGPLAECSRTYQSDVFRIHHGAVLPTERKDGSPVMGILPDERQRGAQSLSRRIKEKIKH